MNHLDAVIKAYDDAGSGSWTAIASAPTVDRHNEIIGPRALFWVSDVLPVHHPHYGELVGSAKPKYVGDVLYVEGRFASGQKAQEVRRLVNDGHLTAMSVMFMPGATSRPGDKGSGVRSVITSAELLAVDFVTIGSNRDAHVLASRSYSGSMSELDRARLQVAAVTAQLALADARNLVAPLSYRQQADRLIRG